MRSSWDPSETELADYARTHLWHEVWVLTGQVEFLVSLHDPSVTPLRNALLEAPLIHLRLLDDFLGSGRQIEPPRRGDRDDVYARHWLPSWTPTGFLTAEQRRDVHGDIAHLTARREWQPGPRWRILDLALACCDGMRSFIDALDAERPDRAIAFEDTSKLVDDWFRRFRSDTWWKLLVPSEGMPTSGPDLLAGGKEGSES